MTDDWHPGAERGNQAEEWRGEEWVSFWWGTYRIERRLGLSTGAAQRTLREVCASGDIRSIRYRDYDEAKSLSEREPEIIRPSEWRKDELDLMGEVEIDVSLDDLEHWLAKQPGASAEVGKQTKRSVVKEAIKAKWPNDIPRIVSNGQIVKEVGDWLSDYWKRENVPKLDISADTILRAAGRKGK